MGRKKKTQVEYDAPLINGSEEVPAEHREKYLELVTILDEFCRERLDEEYQAMCRRMAMYLLQDGSPAVRGKLTGWAAGIVYAIGWINFFGDSNSEPHIPAEEIAKSFGVSPATMYNKTKVLREGLDLMGMDPEFSHPSRLLENPLVWMIEANGIIVDLRDAPREVQVIAYERGLIPFIHADRVGT